MVKTDETLPDIRELIHRRRRQVLVHSILYYRMNQNLVTDYTYDGWARELAQLQKDHPRTSSQVEYMREAFKDFTGETGAFLPLDDRRATQVAKELLKGVAR